MECSRRGSSSPPKKYRGAESTAFYKTMRNGFTLLEVLVAMAVIAIAFTAALRLHTQTIAMSGSSRFNTVAPMLARERMEWAMRQKIAQIRDEEGDFGENHPFYHWRLAVEDVESEILGDVVRNMKKIGVTVIFGADEQTYTLRSYAYLEE